MDNKNIKNWIGLMFIVLLPILGKAQSNQNYVRTHSFNKKVSSVPSNVMTDINKDHVETTTQIVDGLGRPIQTIIRRGSAGGNDIIQHMEYDQYGHQPLQFLPYVQNGATNGTYRSSPVSELSTFYNSSNDNIANTNYYYSHQELEKSPLNRVLFTAAPGDAWVGADKKVIYDYSTNVVVNDISTINLPADADSEKNNVYTATGSIELQNEFEFTATSGNSFEAYISSYKADEIFEWDIVNDNPVSGDLYKPGELFVSKVTDENGNATLEFKDKRGNVVLKKVAIEGTGNNAYLWTYYIYDDFNNLRFVIPPEGVKTLFSNGWIVNTAVLKYMFRYKYDARQRLVEKIVPGSGTIFMVYDQLDRLVMTQDANQRKNPDGSAKSVYEWSFTKYDQFNRAVITGTHKDASKKSRATMQSNMDAHSTSNYFVVKSTANCTTSSAPNGICGYTDSTFPVLGGSDEVLTLTYYDDYSFTNRAFTQGSGNAYTSALADANTHLPAGSRNGSDLIPVVVENKVKGMMTGSRVRVIGTNDWINTVTFYDKRGRVIQTQSDNLLGGEEILTTQYDFAGRARATYLHHTNTGTNYTDLKILKTFVFDHAGRIKEIHQKINNEAWEVIAKNNFNELDELKEKILGLSNTLGSRATQTINYTYNIRGWLTKINDAALAGTTNDDLFGMELFYESGFGAPQYNGDIAGIKWKTGSSDAQRAYAYTYDKASRLKSATYSDDITNSIENYTVNNITYDGNGNILSLDRKGLTEYDGDNSISRVFGDIDKLSYTYDGNQLKTVSDNATNNEHPAGDFIDGNTSGDDYTYDPNGNMFVDKNKGITNIEYNHLNLPSKVSFGVNKYIEYLYDAAGIKLRKTVNDEGTLKVTDYIGGFVFEDNQLQFMHMDEGRVLPKEALPQENATGFVYEYHYKDHLGNLRVSFREGALQYKATMETGEEEENIFLNITETRNNEQKYEGTYAAKLNALTNPIGPYKELKISKGDKISLKVLAKYLTDASSSSSSAWTSFFNANFGSTGSETGSQYGNLGAGINAYKPTQSQSTIPNAYLQIIFYNENNQPVQQGHVQITTNSKNNWQEYNVTGLLAGHSGYAKVFVANESETDVWFDNIEVTHETVIVQENHYYPFGLNMAGIEKKGNPDHLFQYNGKEKQEEFGLNWSDYGFRMYDQAIARFTTLDPLAEDYSFQSPFVYAANNPIRYTDFMGMGPDDKVYENETISTYSVGENSVTITTTSTTTVSNIVKDGAITKYITETFVTTNSVTITPGIDKNGKLDPQVTTSTESIETSRETTTMVNTSEGEVQIGETQTESNLYGNDGTKNISLANQERTVSSYGQALISEMNLSINERGVGHAVSNEGANRLAAVGVVVGIKAPWQVSAGIGTGFVIGTGIRNHHDRTNFAGTSFKLNHQYQKFSRNSSGQKTVIATLRDRLGGHE
ncbi:DUF6443 domain-containing protein [Flexithrix dorotheae]|uniref:DUF6443 domain-containing protein n=1 Tax=Flexithrix dorotheae TaxID=70993 RepID=UPI000370E185|nr:DUF6443 domain-containing protein [Flexithrix dorotheae]